MKLGYSGTCELHLDKVILVDPDANKISNVTINNVIVEKSEGHAKPDLVIIDKWVNVDNCTICYNVTNIGTGTALAGHTTLFVEVDEVAYSYVDVALEPNANYIGCFDYLWTYIPPEDIITVRADNNNTMTKTNETNNCLNETRNCSDVDFLGDVSCVARHCRYGELLDCCCEQEYE